MRVMTSSITLIYGLVLIFFHRVPATAEKDELSAQVLSALKKASVFMEEKVSNRGGFLMLYTSDLSEQWGELPATKSMIWVQDPATVGVGEVFLDAYELTGDELFLEFSKRAADALITGQHPEGGWHYFIDFKPEEIPQWYKQVGSKCWGWEEFYHYCGNCTFDDNVHVGASRFLLHLFLKTGEKKYGDALRRALDFLVDAQYPNGAWPQRYPPCDRTTHPDYPFYPDYYTFNDDVILGNIDFLWEAAQCLQRDEYRQSALRGMDFVVLSQLPKPQAGWAQQYDLDLKPAAARSYEPAAVSLIDTLHNIRALEDYFKLTGDRKYLEGIPAAIDWIRNSKIPENQRESGKFTHAIFYEIGTNKPLYAHRTGNSRAEGRYWIDYSTDNLLRGYGFRVAIDPDSLKREYERVASLTREEALKEVTLGKATKKLFPKSDSGQVVRLIESLDERGAWVEDLSFPDTEDYMNNPPRKFQGISTGTFIQNTRILLGYLEEAKRN